MPLAPPRTPRVPPPPPPTGAPCRRPRGPPASAAAAPARAPARAPGARGEESAARPKGPASPSFHPVLQVSQALRQRLVRHAQACLHGPERQVQPLGDLPMRQPLEVGQHHDAPLLLGKGGERCVHLPVPPPPRHRRFVRRRPRRATALPHLGLLQMRRLAPPPPPPAQGVERPAARNRQHPGYEL